MSFDRPTRNRLAKMVGEARERLKADVIDQLRRLGFQEDGSILPLDRIAGLSDEQRAAAEALRAQLTHFTAAERGPETSRRHNAFDRMAREIGFTILNRLVALRMAEERGLIVESVRKGLGSGGYRLFEQVANGALGSRTAAYRTYLECLYDELALDLPVVFDRGGPESSIFPDETCLHDVLELVNAPDLAHLWAEDETIGWVYQYYNDPVERKKMRESSAPRNSRELAVRNQFFTPRYVVEFLTDNTLGRIWYEMRQGDTQLRDDCRYLVRRAHPIWLAPGDTPPQPIPNGAGFDWLTWDWQSESRLWTPPNPDLDDLGSLWAYALSAGRSGHAEPFADFDFVAELANRKLADYRRTGTWEGTFEELRMCLFFEQRRWRHIGDDPDDDDLAALRALHRAICVRWDVEAEVIPHRAKKDPRDLKILDPASGSCHFLLYAFDLLLVIYDESWDDPELGPALRRDYADRDAFDRAVPSLILARNLHGVDIDPRACQIGALALWLRAQRRFAELGLAAVDRPPIDRGNIVCAEPMPGERDLLDEYLQTIDVRLRPLVRTVWEKMQLAGEAGSLLKIEEEISAALDTARADALVPISPVQLTILKQDEQPRQLTMNVGREEQRFWKQAEERLLDALRAYAEQAANGQTTARRLFAHDAVQGFAFIDLCRHRYDVMLMNPPFGEAAMQSRGYVDASYPLSRNDLFAVFVERGFNMLATGSRLGAITSRAGFFKPALQQWRSRFLLRQTHPLLIADLGHGVMDSAMVEAAAYCLESAK